MTKTAEQYQKLRYPIEIVEDEDGRFVATISDLAGCASFGDSIDEAVKGVLEVKDLWIAGRIASGQYIPEPSHLEDFSGKFVVRLPRNLHKSLDHEAKKQDVSLNQYIVHLLSERHMGDAFKKVFEESVRATLAAMVSRPHTIVVNASPGELGGNWHVPNQRCWSFIQQAGAADDDVLDFLPDVTKPPKTLTQVVKQRDRLVFEYDR